MRIKELQQQLDDMDYTEQQALVNLHILPSDYEQQDFFRMNQVLLALAPEDRPQDPADLFSAWGLDDGKKI